jgi:phosphoribosylaminoimidazole-succinocarboxamide synthase
MCSISRARALPAGTPPGEYLLMVATDRLSAFDVVLPDPIPGKGEMLCQVAQLLVRQDRAPDAQPPDRHRRGQRAARGVDQALYAKRAVSPPEAGAGEAIVRGYLIGSGWKEYQRTGKVSGIACPTACARPSSCRSRSHPRQGRRRRPRREHRLMRW